MDVICEMVLLQLTEPRTKLNLGFNLGIEKYHDYLLLEKVFHRQKQYQDAAGNCGLLGHDSWMFSSVLVF